MFVLVTMGFCGCGYSFSPTPYQLRIPEGGMTLHVGVAQNRSRFARLGPELTRNMIEKLSGVPGLRIGGPTSEATLELKITSVVVGTGSWEIRDRRDSAIPESSSSRTVRADVEAIFTRPADLPEGKAVSRRTFSSYRTYVVSQLQGQEEMQEAEALKWIIDDISQKIATLMFTEF
jgi:hypothetical protein